MIFGSQSRNSDMNRKRTADDADLDSDEKFKFPNRSTASRQMQGDGEDGNKHSIDSDEEEEIDKNKYEILDDEEIEGQEDDTIEKDGEVKITPFNLKEEQEEGDFSTDGAFVWKKTREVNDAWLENIDWVKVKSVTSDDEKRQAVQDLKEDEAEAAYDQSETYKAILALMKPGETVARAIRRLSGASGSAPGQQRIMQQRQRKIDQKLKKGQPLSPEEEATRLSRLDMTKLTGLADAVLSRSGNMEIYEETYEKISYLLKQTEDDALDMFADELDGKPKEEIETEKTVIDFNEEVHWEFKWENTDSAEIHGPHSSSEMLKWQENSFFAKGVYVRKVGGSKDFTDGKRIDFDLYV